MPQSALEAAIAVLGDVTDQLPQPGIVECYGTPLGKLSLQFLLQGLKSTLTGDGGLCDVGDFVGFQGKDKDPMSQTAAFQFLPERPDSAPPRFGCHSGGVRALFLAHVGSASRTAFHATASPQFSRGLILLARWIDIIGGRRLI